MKPLLLRIWLILALCLVPVSFGTGVSAQTSIQQPDYTLWEQTVNRAEDAIDAGRASDAALEELRAQLVTWRTGFQAAQTTNQNAIKSVKEQITALGAAPEDGVEAFETAQQRRALSARLATLVSPVKAADVAYSHADGLIRGIDQIIRERQTSALLQIGPSPVDPANWGEGYSQIRGLFISIRNEFRTALDRPLQRKEMMEDLPFTLLLLVVGALLLLRGRRLAEQWAHSVIETSTTARRWLISFGLSLGQMVLPLLGLVLLAEAVYSTGLVGLRGDIFLSALPTAAMLFFAARWLGARLFLRSQKADLPLLLTPMKRREGRLYAGGIGLILALNTLILAMSGFENWSQQASVVVLFAPLCLASVLLFRLARLLLIHTQENPPNGEERPYRTRLVMILARALSVVAIVSPILAAVGYFTAAQAILFPSILSLMVLGFLLILQRLIGEIYILFTGNREGVKDSLIPVIAGLVLVLLSFPFFALIWGRRLADLTEMWTRFKDGVQVGETVISPSNFLTFAIIFAVGYSLTRLLQGTLKNTILPKTRIDVGGQNAVVTGLGYVGIFLAALIAINSAGIDLSSLAIVAGALSVGIGFGLQNIVSNFVSGIILLIERPISEGDWIEVGGHMGYVRDISVRSTRIETFDRTDVIVPNADLVSGTVTNFTRGNTIGRVIVPVGVAYGSDTREIERILLEIGKAHPMVVATPAPYVVFVGFGADSLDFEIRAILRDVNWVLSVKSEMNHEIARRFGEEGVEIPFAQRDIWLRNPESLQTEPRKFANPSNATKRKPVGDETTPKDVAEGDLE